jgi:hypothetical protein
MLLFLKSKIAAKRRKKQKIKFKFFYFFCVFSQLFFRIKSGNFENGIYLFNPKLAAFPRESNCWWRKSAARKY